MHVKVVSLFLAMLVLVTAVTAGGGLVQAADVTSPAFDHCLRAGAAAAACRPAVRIVASAEEFGNLAGEAYGGVDAVDAGGNDLSSPEFWQEVLAAIVRAGLVELARQLADSVIGGSLPDSGLEAVVRPDLFDPGR
jgi:hypothetical protein